MATKGWLVTPELVVKSLLMSPKVVVEDWSTMIIEGDIRRLVDKLPNSGNKYSCG
uniref:Uncharacterized protein n=1 Tax=Cucumis melo TaxID=3656 RepID=A0A9I9DV26_CUCME